MRNENLRDELNQLPQDFDREKLWQGIDLPKKKRRRGGVFWWFGVGMLMFLGVFGALYFGRIDASDISNGVEKKEPLVNTEKSKSEMSPKTSGISSSDLKSQDAFREDIPALPITNNEPKNPYKSSLENDKREEEFNRKSTLETQSERIKSEMNNKRLKNTESGFDNFDKLNNSDIDQNRSNEKDFAQYEAIIPEDNAYRAVEDIAQITLPLKLKQSDWFEMDEDIALYESDAINTSKFAISLFSTAGASSHNFGVSDFTQNRLSNEEALESIGIGFLTHFDINRWNVFSGLSYAMHNTHFTFENEERLIINNFNNPAERLTKTQYSLYNSYQYLDLIVGAGYTLALSENWSISPSLQIGYSVNSSLIGSLFDPLNQEVRISEIDNYNDLGRWQGQANITIGRKVAHNWKIGLIAYASTSKALANFEESTHSVSSYGLGLMISRFIK